MTETAHSDDPDRRWPVAGALLLALVGAALATPPDPVTQLVALPVLALACLPPAVYVAARSPASDGGRPLLAFLGLGAVAGWAAVEVAFLLPFDAGGLLPLVAFAAGVYLAAAAIARRVLVDAA